MVVRTARSYAAESARLATRIFDLEAENAELKEKNELLNAIFEKQYDRDMEASMEWRKANPGNDLVLPDRGSLMLHVLDRAEAAEKKNARLREAFVDVENMLRSEHVAHYARIYNALQIIDAALA